MSASTSCCAPGPGRILPRGIWFYFIWLGLNSGIVGYCAKHRPIDVADAATVAPFEYVGPADGGVLGLADLGRAARALGRLAGHGADHGFAGLFVFLREHQKARKIARAEVKGRY